MVKQAQVHLESEAKVLKDVPDQLSKVKIVGEYKAEGSL